jgi:maltose-binding protein MalE
MSRLFAHRFEALAVALALLLLLTLARTLQASREAQTAPQAATRTPRPTGTSTPKPKPTATSTPTPPCVFYVDADATAAKDGTSWEDAYTGLQPALEDAADGCEIWVAQGTYTPTYLASPDDSRSATFQLRNGVALYGGFDPSVGDITWGDRDWVKNAVILSGDIGIQGDPADNSYHVFYHPAELALDGSAALDGFTVSDGNANGGDDHDNGGGMANDGSSPAVINCTFLGNSAAGVGGGMYNHSSSPVVTKCTFSGNAAESVGGGMYNGGSSPVVTHCTFSGNSAVHQGGGMFNESASAPEVTHCTFLSNLAGSYGGGMANRGSSPAVTGCTFLSNSVSYGGGAGMFNELSSSPTVTNCTFRGNSAQPYGGGMYNADSSPTLTNCTFSGNSASYGGGVFNHASSSPEVTNCILWGDGPDEISNSDSRPLVTYSDIEGGYEGEGNIDVDPLFVDSSSADYHLGPGSPCIDAGANDAPNLPLYDFEGDPRVIDGNGDGAAVVDMGIDEVPGNVGMHVYLPLVLRPEPPRPVDITVWHAWRESEIPALSGVIDSFEAQNPNVTFDVLYVPFEDLRGKYETAAAAGGGPTVLLGASDWGPGWWDAGLIADLTHLTDPDFLATILPAALVPMQYNGALFALPHSTKGVVLYRNISIVSESQSTYADLVAAAQAATGGDILGAVLERGFFFSAAHLNALGGQLMYESGCPAFNDEKGVVWLNLLDSFTDAGPAEYYTDNDVDLFKAGKVGFIIDGTWNMDDLRGEIGEENLAIDPWPTPMSGYVQVDSIYLNPNAIGEEQSAGWNFMEYFLSPEVQAMLVGAGHIPTVTGVSISDPLMAQAFSAFIGGTAFPVIPEMASYWGPMDTALKAVFDEGADPAAVLAEAYYSIAQGVQYWKPGLGCFRAFEPVILRNR